ncbi:type II toxin-antitoxin system VapC family toxin [Candidatus Marithrix sp. Canyon 246]|uniref:type II toxin-antitoxin system VapC family toxin n=1 Tax=Candidatus Marithrix sp. Canyon 246 TaxID=1827136 RepID=UPI00084A0A6D|nr:PIN domain-containing protein [Candidatus Marithrix sp. Canyon 246]
MKQVIVDTGPLVALLSEKDVHHDWVTKKMANIHTPLLTCEAVISETCFLLKRHSHEKADVVLELIDMNFMKVPFFLGDNERKDIRRLMVKYANVPMSFADACLVKMSEQYSKSLVLTLDSDFLIYRRYGNQSISTIMPYD